MKKLTSHITAGIFALLLTCVFLTPASVASAQDFSNRKGITSMEARSVVPLVTLRNWKESKPDERYAFLVGLVTMLEIEKEWQLSSGKKLQPFKQSLIGSWVDGFQGVRLKDMYDSVNQHIAANPGDLDRPVPEVLWFKFVQPKVKK